MNIVLLTGRLTKTPELSVSADGMKHYCRFCLAVDRGKDKNGEEITDFPRIVAFDKLAENLSKYVEKGQMIAVNAELHTDKYEKDGKMIYTEELIANKIDYLDRRRNVGESKEENL